jgi:hypothetical protein
MLRGDLSENAAAILIRRFRDVHPAREASLYSCPRILRQRISALRLLIELTRGTASRTRCDQRAERPQKGRTGKITWRCTKSGTKSRISVALPSGEHISGERIHKRRLRALEPISGYVYVTSLCERLSRMHSTSRSEYRDRRFH